MDELNALAASNLVSSATLAALVARLRRIGLFSAQDEREVYEHALMLLEQGQAASPDMAAIYEAAREVIEEQLR